jgi:hypothetical protein
MLEIKHPCWGHSCDKYTNPELLYEEILVIYKKQKELPITFEMFLLELEIRATTPEHWKTCKPMNLKVLEYVELYSDRSVFNSIRSNAGAVMKFWELTKDKKLKTSDSSSRSEDLKELIKKNEESNNEF